jgi:Skp family chaperone for outer membrane proteins
VGLDINVLVTLLFGAGAGGAIAGIINVIKTVRSGKIETEETLIKRLDADNKNQQERARKAEERAEAAEKEAEEYRRQRNRAQEELARTRWFMLQKGLELPKFGEGNE